MTRRLLLGLAVVLMITHLYNSAFRPVFLPGIPPPPLLRGVFNQTAVFLLFTVAHALYSLGWRHTLLLFVLSVTIAWSLEEGGVVTGSIYGGYHYTDFLGPMLGHVPILIPLSWFIMIYLSYVLANCLLESRPVGTRGGITNIIALSLVGALLMTSRDLIIDPFLSGPNVQAWVWEQGGEYFGVPALNFLGWAVTSLLIYVPYRFVESRVAPRPEGPITRGVATMALVMYGVLMISGTVNKGISELIVIGPIVLGLPVLIAFVRVWSKSVNSMSFG